MAAPDDPVGAPRLGTLFSSFEKQAGVVLAVSGGADSTALMLLAARWRDEGHSVPLSVATVDHGLRSESPAECLAVADAAARLGLTCRILRWEGTKPATGLQARAREARLDLLAEAARQAGADAVALAHTIDDQAETVLMRLARGSGPAGLAAMRASSRQRGVALLRPLLGLTKASLVATLHAAAIGWSEDPSNADPRFERVRARRLLAAVAPFGLTPRRLSTLAAREARASEALDALATERFAGLAHCTEARVTFDAGPLAALPQELRVRLLALALPAAGPGPSLRLERLEALELAIRRAVGDGATMRRSLAGKSILVAKGRIEIGRESPRRRGRPGPKDQS